MRKLLLLSAIFFVAFSATLKAQNDLQFKPFKVDVSIGLALPVGGTGGKTDALFVIEPKYAVIPQLSVGLRIEAAATLSGVDLNTGYYNNDASAKASASYLATGDYYFTNSNLRPFAGAGLGLYHTAGVDINSNNSVIAEGYKFGGMARAGAEFRHLRFGIEYNFVPKTTVPESSSGANDSYTYENSI